LDEYDLIRQSSVQVMQETDPSQGAPGGSIPLISQGYVLATTATQQAVDASDRGWWRHDGYHDSSNKNTFTGQNGNGTQLFNSFFVFDLTSISGNSVESAILRLEVENYFGPDSSESLTIYDVATPIPVLTASGTDVGVYTDLQSGNDYGNFTVHPSDEGSIIEITLNSQALADIEAAIGGQFAVGLHVNNISLPSGNEGVRFSLDDEARVHQLILTTSTGGGGGGGQGSPLTYDVYLGTDISQMELVGSDLEEPAFSPCILDYETAYYWQVVAKSDCGLTMSPIWSFTTQLWQPLPEDGAMEVLIDTMLNWNGPIGSNEQTQDAVVNNDVICTPPEGMSFREGILIEGTSEDSTPVVPTDVTVQSQLVPGATLIDFDDISAPCLFMDTVRLTNEYASLGVIFEGPSGNDGAAIVNECGNWSVSGHSSPNFLGINGDGMMSDGGRPIGPETIYFDPPVSYVELLAGSSTRPTVTLEAYDGNGSVVDNSSLSLSNTLSPISVSGTNITRVVISSSSNLFVLDDLQFVPDEEEPPPLTSPITYDVYFGLNPNEPNTWNCIDEGLNTPECDPTPELDELLEYVELY
jgi:hypothetical protein